MPRKRLSIPRLGLFAVTAVLLIFIVTPLAVAVAGAFINATFIGMSSEQWSSRADVFIGFDAFNYLFRHYSAWMVFSLELALASVVICLLLAVPAGYALVQMPFFGSGAIEDVLMLPLSIPGIALSIALIAAYNSIRGHWLVLAGHLLYTLPFMVRVVTSTLRSYDLAMLEDAAQSLGATFFTRMHRIVLPGLRHALITGSLLVFAISWGEFNVSYLLNYGRPQTFPAALYDTNANESFQISSVATVLFLLVAIHAAIAVQWLGGTSSIDSERSA